MRERIVLIGAGSAMFTRGLVADLLRSGVELQQYIANQKGV